MSSELNLTPSETQVITNISRSFARRMRWNPQWEINDIFQELCLYWLKLKQSGWQKPQENDWKGAMGRCLLCHLKDIQKRECSRRAKTGGPLSSFEALLDAGFDIPAPDKPPFPFDLPELSNSPDRLICDLLIQGESKKAISQKLGKSRPYIYRRLQHVRHLCEEKV